jgi:hypothetical protein
MAYRRGRSRTRPGSIVTNAPDHATAELTQPCRHHARPYHGGNIAKSKIDDTPCRAALSENKLAEVLVSRDQDFTIGLRQDLLIIGCRTDFGRPDNVEPFAAESGDSGARDAFICEEVGHHSAANTDSRAKWSAAKACAARISSMVRRG